MKKIPKDFKGKSLLWYAGIVYVVLGIVGIAYGAFVIYNGILLSGFESEGIENALAAAGMSQRDGVYALVGFGVIILFLYLIMLGAGILGLMSAKRILTRRTLFWYAIIIFSLLLLLGISGILEWGLAGVGIVASLFYAFSVYQKFNRDLNFLREKGLKEK